jgi:hypothetical protein
MWNGVAALILNQNYCFSWIKEDKESLKNEWQSPHCISSVFDHLLLPCVNLGSKANDADEDFQDKQRNSNIYKTLHSYWRDPQAPPLFLPFLLLFVGKPSLVVPSVTTLLLKYFNRYIKSWLLLKSTALVIKSLISLYIIPRDT